MQGWMEEGGRRCRGGWKRVVGGAGVDGRGWYIRWCRGGWKRERGSGEGLEGEKKETVILKYSYWEFFICCKNHCLKVKTFVTFQEIYSP